MRVIFSVLALILLQTPLKAGDGTAAKHAEVVGPYVDDMTFVIVHVDVSKIDFDVVAKYLDEADVEKTKAIANLAKTTFLKAGGKDIYLVMNWAKSLEEPLFVIPLPASADTRTLINLVKQIPGYESDLKGRSRPTLVAGTKKTLARLRDFKAQPIRDLDQAFQAVGEGTAQIVFVPPFALKRAFVEMYPTLPKELGGGNSSVLNFQWAAARINAGDKIDAKLVVQAPDEKGAKAIASVASRALDFGSKGPGAITAGLVASLRPKVDGDRLSVALDDRSLTQALLPLVQKTRESASRSVSTNNLRQIAIAMHNYLDMNGGRFPAQASHDAAGKPLLSWRVHILPFVEQDALYKKFHLDEPWDSEHNKMLIAQMPKIYRSPLQRHGKEGKTIYLVPVGPKTIFGGKKGMRIQEITDGTSNTIMLVEVDDSRGVYWTKPEDYKVDEKNPMKDLLRPESGGFLAAFADGSARFISAGVLPSELNAYYTANGGEPIGEDRPAR